MSEFNNKTYLSIAKSKPTPVLIVETLSGLTNVFITDFLKIIACDQELLFCNQCNVCEKINNDNYFDLFTINADNLTATKEKVIEILNKFNSSALEKNGNKFLIINGVEKINKQTANVLLKAIENPNKNTYYLFTTKNIYNVITTIKSRCLIFYLRPNIEGFKQNLIAKNVDQKYLNFFTSHFYNPISALNFYQSKNFEKIINIVHIIKNENQILSKVNKSLSDFKTLSYFEITYLLLMLKENLNLKKQKVIYDLVNNLKYNLNKTLIFNTVFDLYTNNEQ